MSETSNDPNRCCANGFFGEAHDCQKQPPQVVEEAPRERVQLKRKTDTDEKHISNAIEPVKYISTPKPPTTELTFLLDLLLTEKLSQAVKAKITDRIREVEAKMVAAPAPQFQVAQNHAHNMQPPPVYNPAGANPGIHAHLPPPPPLEGQPMQANNSVIASALRARELTLASALSEKPMPGETGPRKFRGQL